MKRFELVIAGGGLTAARAIKSYRAAGGSGRIALVAREPALPYHRPALSKRYLRGETLERPLVEDEAFYRDHDVELLLETDVDAVDAAGRSVTTSAGSRLGFEKLLIATGALPRRLKVPGADLDGVHALRTVNHSETIRAEAAVAKRAVVVGGGFIGLEVAASLRILGLHVTLVNQGALFEQLGSPALSEELVSLYRQHGVELVLGDDVASFEGRSKLASVTTAGGRRIDAELAVVGIGVVPSVEFLEGSGLRLDNGVVVDEQFDTGVPGIHAAGDVANVFDPLFDRRRRIEHWSNADYQGTEVGRVLAGKPGGYDHVSSFFSELFGITIKVFGDVSLVDRLASDGSLGDGRLLTVYGHRGRLVGALTAGQSVEVEERLRDAIASRAPFVGLYLPEEALSVTST